MSSRLDPLLFAFARLMVAQGVLFPAFVERMKLQYLKAAERETARPSDSAISVATGLQRRDIARLRSVPGSPDPAPNALARLVAQWDTRAAYPKTIPRQGPAPSFDALARSIRKDVHPRTLLDALVAAGTVAVVGQDVRLLQSSYQPLAGSDEQLDYLASNVGAHLDAARENVTLSPAPHFERAVHYDGLSNDAVAELEAMYRTAQQTLLEDINRKAAALQVRSGGNNRFRAGGYFYGKEETGDDL